MLFRSFDTDRLDVSDEAWGALAIEMCDRHMGVGADGIIVVQPSATADRKMRIFNADGSDGVMCVNGIRCFTKYALDRGLVVAPAGDMVVETGPGHVPVHAFRAAALHVGPQRPLRRAESFVDFPQRREFGRLRNAPQLQRQFPKLAQQFLEQAAIGGNPAAEEKMGRSCIEGGAFDADCAKMWLQSAAAQGRVSAISVLAWLYVREGSAQSLAEAGKLYQTAAEAGDFAAQNNLGEFFETGRGLAKDPQQAFNWYRKSAEGGFAPGQFNLARLYAFGLGTTRDTAAARDWAFKAQAQGVAQAAELLRIISDAQARGEP